MVRPGDCIDASAAGRIERDISEIKEVLQSLVLLEERQSQHSTRLEQYDTRLQRLAEDLQQQREALSRWINRGIGLWSAALLIWALLNSRFVSGG